MVICLLRLRLQSMEMFSLGDASTDYMKLNLSRVDTPNGLNFDANTLVIDDDNDRVGIGIANPATNLHIQSAGDPSLRIMRTGEEVWDIKSGTSGLSIQEGGTNRIYIGQTNGDIGLNPTGGGVGVGTLSPDAKLHVKSTGNEIIELDNSSATVSLSMSGDRIFHDTDADGTKDAGEEFIDQVGIPTGTTKLATLHYFGGNWVENTKISTNSLGAMSIESDFNVGGNSTFQGFLTLPSGGAANNNMLRFGGSGAGIYGTANEVNISTANNARLTVQSNGIVKFKTALEVGAGDNAAIPAVKVTAWPTQSVAALAVKAGASQTGNLQEWQNSSGTASSITSTLNQPINI